MIMKCSLAVYNESSIYSTVYNTYSMLYITHNTIRLKKALETAPKYPHTTVHMISYEKIFLIFWCVFLKMSRNTCEFPLVTCTKSFPNKLHRNFNKSFKLSFSGLINDGIGSVHIPVYSPIPDPEFWAVSEQLYL